MAIGVTGALIFSLLSSFSGIAREAGPAPGPADQELFQERLEEALLRYAFLAEQCDSAGLIPSAVTEEGMRYANPSSWVSGFFPGSLWYLYEYTGDEYWKNKAARFTTLLRGQSRNTSTHDLGFMMYCSYGNAYRLTGNGEYKKVLLESAASLCKRYDPRVGVIKSWDFPGWWKQYAVIIDNMMNLELLTWASEESGNDSFRQVALSHSWKTLRNHYRDDYSCYHVVDYDTISGRALKKGTLQGAHDESSWSRGQAWGLYGYTMMYRETGQVAFLKQARAIAEYLLKALADEPVPVWDLSLFGVEGEEKDASAAAIIASALVELYEISSDTRYLDCSRSILLELSSPQYSGGKGETGELLLKHSVGHKPGNSGIDVQLSYADYYYIEALLRIMRVEGDKGSSAGHSPGRAIEAGDPPNTQDIPDFFTSGLEAIENEINMLERGELKILTHSPGGHPVYAISYGEKEDFQSRANYNSAIGARDPSSYAKRNKDSKPVLFFLGPVHGQEMEGIAGLVNLVHIAETGMDHRGKQWPGLRQKLDQCRIVIIPCGNPDGRQRCPYDSFLGLPTRVMTKYGQGTHKDGTSWGWPGAKSLHPMQGDVDILGAYFNDAGINIMHDEFFSPMADETRAILDLARAEAPDLAVSLHSFELVSRILPVSYLPWYMKEEVQELSRMVNRAYREKGLPAYPDGVFGDPVVEDPEYPPRTSFNLTSALHHSSGCLAFTHECSHGSFGGPNDNPDISFGDILDYELILFECMVDYALAKKQQL